MTPKQGKGAFIVWRKFQRRVEVLAPFLGLEIYYFSYSWEEKSKIFKAYSYVLKMIATLKCLFQRRPSLVFIQFPPPPALYCVAFYAWLTNTRYIVDCHMEIANDHWIKWIYVKQLLVKGKLIVHNEHLIEPVIRSVNTKPIVLRDGIANRYSRAHHESALVKNLNLRSKSYVIVPCSFSLDEPIIEIIEAAKMLPEIPFIMTWNSERLLATIRNNLPPNVVLTGYLPVDDFDSLFANSGIALVLTKHENVQLSGMQEAMAFEVPAVVTDLRTTRYLYKDCPVFVENDPRSIAVGIKRALENKQGFAERMKKLRMETEKEFLEQLTNLKASLDL